MDDKKAKEELIKTLEQITSPDTRTSMGRVTTPGPVRMAAAIALYNVRIGEVEEAEVFLAKVLNISN